MIRGLVRGRLVGALGIATLLIAGCGTSVEPTPSASPVTVPEASIVIPNDLGPLLATAYQEAVSAHGQSATVVDGPVAGVGIVALGGSVPGAAAVVMGDPAALGQQLAGGLGDCLQAVGVVGGPVLLASLPQPAVDAATAVLSQRGFAASVLPSGDPSTAVDAWYTSANGDVVGIVAGDAATAQAAVRVLDANAQAVKVPIAGYGLDPDATARLADGSQCIALRPAVKKEASAAIDLIAALKAGTDVHVAARDAIVTADGSTVPGILVPPTVVRGEGGQG